MQKYPEIWKRICDIKEDALSLKYLISDSPIFHFEVNKENINKDIQTRVRNDGLRFSKEYDHWTIGADSKLREYICSRKSSWKLNEKSLKALRAYFDNRFDLETLRIKCLEYGVSWDSELSNNVVFNDEFKCEND